jgi:TldD protein
MAAGSLWARPATSMCHIPLSAKHAALPARAFLRQRITASELRAFATRALDAAKSAGANYADVRVAERIQLSVGSEGAAYVSGATLVPEFMYGVRVNVRGAWAFVHGVTPSHDAITTAAQQAVMTAAGYAGLGDTLPVPQPGPVVTGDWETPMEIDPFTVPLGDQAALLSAFVDAISRVRNAGKVFSSFMWIRETRVFGSTDGMMVTQVRRTSEPYLDINGNQPGLAGYPVYLSGLRPTSGGYESVTRPELQDELKQIAEDAAWFIALPRRSLDVGRYPVVFDGTALGTAFLYTVGQALEMDRVLGYESGGGQGSYLGPSSEKLGAPIANPLLSVVGNRAFPSITAAKWDDDGVECCERSLITQGRLTHYLTSQQATVESLKNSVAHSSSGCAVSPHADDLPLVRVPHVTIAPATERTSLSDLCRDISHGVLIRDQRHVWTDPSGASALLTSSFGAALEIERGRIVRRLDGNGLQFSTPRFWHQSLAALGDATTVKLTARQIVKGQPETRAWSSASAPAALFKDVDVIGTRIRI